MLWIAERSLRVRSVRGRVRLHGRLSWFCALGLGAVLCVSAIACSDQPGGIEGENSETNREIGAGISDAHDDLGPDSDTGESHEVREISVDIIAALFPATAENAKNIDSLFSLFGEILDLHLQQCMGHAGFDYKVPNEAPSTRFYDFPDLDQITKRGFGVTLSAESGTGPADPLHGIPLGLRDQFMEDFGACYDAYDSPEDQIFAAAAVLQDQWYGELAEIDTSLTIQTEFSVWNQCMADGGHPVISHESFFVEFDRIVLDLLDDMEPAEVEAAHAYEMTAAELYVTCMEPLEEVRQPLRDAARREFLEDNSEELRAIQQLADRLISEAELR